MKKGAGCAHGAREVLSFGLSPSRGRYASSAAPCRAEYSRGLIRAPPR